MADVTDEIQRMSELLEYTIINRIVGRLIKRLERGNKKLSATDIMEIDKLTDAGIVIEQVQKDVNNYKKGLWSIVKNLFVDLFDKTPKGVGKKTKTIAETYLRRTQNTAKNLTKTTAIDSGGKYIQELDNAMTLINTGTMSRDEAISEIIDRMTDEGIDTAEYPTGHKDRLSTATTRAIRTGLAQMMGDLTLQQMEENGEDLIIVSSHIGARCYGDDCRNHAKWQGKIFSRTGKDPRYPYFFDTVNGTGYGTLLGLCGVNCRHTFSPTDGTYNPYPPVDDAENKQAYDNQQKARKMERTIRALKGKRKVFKEAYNISTVPEDKEEYKKQADELLKTIKKKVADYVSFCNSIGLKPQYKNLEI